MIRIKTISHWSTLILVALLAIGCGAADAQNQAGEESEGFLDSLFASATETVVVPAGTMLSLRLDDTLSSHETATGAVFSAEVLQEVSVDGRVAVPAGSILQGHVSEARPPKKIGGRAVLALSFDTLRPSDGDSVAISARLTQVGKSEVAKDATIIGASTIGGAILGEAIDDGDGDVVGAIVGGIAGAVGAHKSKGKPVVLPSGTKLQIELESDVSIEVAQ